MHGKRLPSEERLAVPERGFVCAGCIAFVALIDNDTLFFKVDTALAGQYRKAGMPPFMPIGFQQLKHLADSGNRT